MKPLRCKTKIEITTGKDHEIDTIRISRITTEINEQGEFIVERSRRTWFNPENKGHKRSIYKYPFNAKFLSSVMTILKGLDFDSTHREEYSNDGYQSVSGMFEIYWYKPPSEGMLAEIERLRAAGLEANAKGRDIASLLMQARLLLAGDRVKTAKYDIGVGHGVEFIDVRINQLALDDLDAEMTALGFTIPKSLNERGYTQFWMKA